ncbi:MAG: hypothetical protein ACPGSB_00710 [Opitutales bacterium]
MSETKIEKYSAEEWDFIRKRFYSSVLNETEISKLGQNVGISWPFKGANENPAKYMHFSFEELKEVPGIIGKASRVKSLMDILRETLAFDDPFGDMADSLEKQNEVDDTFKHILNKFAIPQDYPAEFIHFSQETKELLKSEEIQTLIECIHFGQNLAESASVVVAGDLKSFLNSLAHKDAEVMASRIPYRPGEGGLHLAEAIGLICRNMDHTTQLYLLKSGGNSLTEEEENLLAAANGASIEASMEDAQRKVVQLAGWFSEEMRDLEQVFTTGGSPERYFIVLNEPRMESIVVELSRMHFAPDKQEKAGLFGRIFGR